MQHHLAFSSGQHLALHEDRPGYIGMICSDMRPVEVIQGAVDDASFMCKRTFGEAPEVGCVRDVMMFLLLSTFTSLIVAESTHVTSRLASHTFRRTFTTSCSSS